jgi:cell division septum initiation protein DivIVA
MPEEPLVVSISSSTSLNPDEIARRSFPTARKGIDADAVRRYLESIADDVRSLLEREAQLRRRVADAERKASEPPVLDEATLTQAVGAETARVLQSANDAAREVVGRAEGRAAELIADAEARAAERSAAAEEESTMLLDAAAEEAATSVAAAQAEAVALRHGAEAEAQTVIEAAQTDAVALLETTKQQCRQTVRDARQLRKAVLSDLVERRRALFVQLEQLRSGRDSLVEVVDAVEATVEELKGRLAGAEHDARMAAAEAGDRAELFVDDEVDTLLEPDIALELQAELLGGGAAAGEEYEPEAVGDSASLDTQAVIELDTDHLMEDEEEQDAAGETAASHRSVGELFAKIRAARGSETAGGEADASGGEAGEAGEAETAAVETGTSEAPGAESGAPAVEAAVVEAPVTEAPVTEAPVTEAPVTEETPTGEAVTEAQASESVGGPAGAGAGTESPGPEEQPAAAAAAGEPETATVLAEADDAASAAPAASHDEEPAVDGDDAARLRRDELLAPVLTRLARALKRALQDDQNELLNAIRHASGAPDLEMLLPEDEQRERYALAASGALADGWLVGRSWLRADGSTILDDEAEVGTSATESGRLLGIELADELSGLLRHRLSESLRTLGELGEGAQDAAGAAYREWKGPRVEGIAGDFATRAFAGGAVAGAQGTIVRWVVDDGKPCPDCDDNALAGEQPAGEAWPTGQTHPPVHPGCRCLLIATSD